MRLEDAAQTTYDLCIVGSGPAGLILALEYTRLRPGSPVLLIEYGVPNQPRTNGLDDTIQLNSTSNHHTPYECTNKGLGGTSATWGGRCVMYDEVDFVDRPVLSGGCTWNTDLWREMNAYLPTAAGYFECGEAVFKLNDSLELGSHRIAQGFREGVVTDSVLERWSKPTRFKERYATEIARRAITLVEGCEARQFAVPDENGRVAFLKVREVAGGQNGQTREIKARRFVLAAGAQESTRILLRNAQLFASLGGPPAVLGRYYQGHVSGKIASVRFTGDPRRTDYGFLRDADGTYVRRRLQFSLRFLKEHNLLNTALWLDNPLYFDPKHRSGAMSFMYLAMITPVVGKKLAPPAIAHSITKGKVTGLPQHLHNILRDLPGSLTTPARIFFQRYFLRRKLPGVFLFSPQNRYALHFHAEQVPLASNRMELGPDGETLIIHYDLSDDDVTSVIRLHEALDDWLHECRCGELEFWYSRSELPQAIREMSRDGIHQCGTTRMADSPETGVVDFELRLWGTQNVFVCSSSVFPTSGQANPTFFLGAFAARLAKHLAESPEV